jgi:hypothetical protein
MNKYKKSMRPSFKGFLYAYSALLFLTVTIYALSVTIRKYDLFPDRSLIPRYTKTNVQSSNADEELLSWYTSKRGIYRTDCPEGEDDKMLGHYADQEAVINKESAGFHPGSYKPSTANNIQKLVKNNRLPKQKPSANVRQEMVRIVSSSSQYFIQIGAWKNPKYALEKLSQLKKYYPEAFIVVENNFNKVRIPTGMSKRQGTSRLKEIAGEFDIIPILIYKKNS